MEAVGHESVYEWAIKYLRNGLSVIPIRYRDKKPAIKSWKEYQIRMPTEEEIEKWFKDKVINIAIICGKVSGNLMVWDFDDMETYNRFLTYLDDDLAQAFKNTWNVKTGRGVQVYFRYPNVDENSKDKILSHKSLRYPELGLDIQRNGKYVVAPPSIHPTGRRYEFIRLTDQIYTLTENQLRKLFNIIEKLANERRKEAEATSDEEGIEIEINKELTEEQIGKIVDLIRPYWKEKRRHDLALFLAGMLFWNGYKKESAIKLIKRICEVVKDEETEDRIRAVEDTYTKGLKALKGEKDPATGEEYRVAYISLIKSRFKTKEGRTISEEELEDLLYKLLKIIKGKVAVGLGVLSAKESDDAIIVCDYKKCCIKKVRYLRFGEKVERKELIIATCVPVDIEIIQNEDNEEYRIKFITKDGQTFTLKGTLKEITSIMKDTVRVTKRQLFDDALSLIVNKAIMLGLCKKIRGERVKGIIIVNDELKAFDFPTDYKDEELKEALILLNDFVKLSEFSKERVKKLSKVIKWFVLAGFGYVLKQTGSWIPHLYLYGESDTGKTATARFLQNIWHDGAMHSLDSISTPFKLGNILNQTTFPVVINEMNFDELRDEIIELWKNAVDGIIIRTRYGKNVKSYGVLCFTSNTGIPSNRAIQKRLEIIHFDPFDAQILIKQKDEFEKLNAKRHKLRAIGKFAFNFIKNNIELLNEYDWEALAGMILREAYRTAGLEVPYWIDYEYKEESDVRVSKSELIRSVLKEAIGKNVKLNAITDNEEEIRFVFETASMRIGWLHVRNYNKIVLTTPVIDYLNKNGIKISNLKDLSYYIPQSEWKKVKINGKSVACLVIDMEAFGRWLGIYKFDEDETLDNADSLVISLGKLLEEACHLDLLDRIEKLKAKGLLSERSYNLLKRLFEIKSKPESEEVSELEVKSNKLELDDVERKIVEIANFVMEVIPNQNYQINAFIKEIKARMGNNLQIVIEKIEKLLEYGILQSHFIDAAKVLKEELKVKRQEGKDESEKTVESKEKIESEEESKRESERESEEEDEDLIPYEKMLREGKVKKYNSSEEMIRDIVNYIKNLKYNVDPENW